MISLRRLIEINDAHKRVKELEKVSQNLRKRADQDIFINEEDLSSFMDWVDLVNDSSSWQALWSILLQLSARKNIVRYCIKMLDQYNSSSFTESSLQRMDFLLRYLFLNEPSERERRLRQFLKCNDAYLQLAAAEELAKTDIKEALENMLDIYESAFHTTNHEVVDSIELWITYELTNDLIPILEEKIERTKDHVLKQRFRELLNQKNMNDFEEF